MPEENRKIVAAETCIPILSLKYISCLRELILQEYVNCAVVSVRSTHQMARIRKPLMLIRWLKCTSAVKFLNIGSSLVFLLGISGPIDWIYS